MLAAQCNCYETVKVLLEYRANVDFRDSENKTVLHYAIGSSDIVKEILKVCYVQFCFNIVYENVDICCWNPLFRCSFISGKLRKQV